ncbi:helix-turn-helix domain-containing protein [Desulfallas thermosapovorans]|uniref:helix-turn-helix domain-containing protein n=1 Tax=Desulfallas thermosapovorans TaxID=58137 RepID=UPI001FA9CEF3|nr:helix-turn-helix domain-containing protein [Desulfallas thermosapovorans]
MQFYTVQQVAKILHVKKDYVYELIHQGKLQAIRMSERRIRISHESLNEFTQNHKVKKFN